MRAAVRARPVSCTCTVKKECDTFNATESSRPGPDVLARLRGHVAGGVCLPGYTLGGGGGSFGVVTALDGAR